jgi:hypothetical protein
MSALRLSWAISAIRLRSGIRLGVDIVSQVL